MTTLTPEAWAQVRAAYEAREMPVEDICVAYDISSTTLRHRMRRWGWTRRRPPVPQEAPVASVIPGRGLLAASPESITPALRRMDSGPAAVAASRNDEEMKDHPTPTVFAPAQTVDPPPPEPAPGRAQARPGWEGESTPATLAKPATPAAPGDIGAQLQSAVARVLPAIEAIIARLAAGAGPREMEQAGRALSSLTRTLRELNALLAQHNARAADDFVMSEDMDAIREDVARRIDLFIASRQGQDFASADAPAGEARPAET